MRFACSITKATDTHSEYLILIFSYDKNGKAKVPHCYLIRVLPVIFISVLCVLLKSDRTGNCY
jgi:hypothetical protein